MDSDTHNLGLLTTQNANTGMVVTRIESILESVVDGLAESQELTINLSSRKKSRQNGQEIRHEQIRFPGKTAAEAKKFARILLILQLSHDALVSGTVLTKRHIFYQHQELFEKQARVDELVDELALTLQVHRDDLNIVAAAKGIVSGPVTIKLHDGSYIDASKGVSNKGVSIPPANCIANIDLGSSRWILVVEKDAIFRSLCSSQFWKATVHGPGALITAKGYPDVVTNSFLELIHGAAPHVPILVLVDFDPDGINIFRCYRQNTATTRFGLGTSNIGIRWMGIKSSQLLGLSAIEPDITQAAAYQTASGRQLRKRTAVPQAQISSTSCRNAGSQLSARDRKVARGTLENLSNIEPQNNDIVEARRELQVMLMMSVKCEIQWLDDAGNICKWLDENIEPILT